MAAADISRVVWIHIQAFEGFFLSSLGPRFLRQFYLGSIADPTVIALVAKDSQGRVVGFAVGPLAPEGFFRRLVIKRWLHFILPSLIAVLSSPACLPRLVRGAFYRGERPQGMNRALLSSIAVDPTLQHGGAGRMLIECWMREVAIRGGTGAYLLTDADQNAAANAFYRKTGWREYNIITRKNDRKMVVYINDIARTS